MDRKVKLLVITPNKTGVGYYRSIKPHVYLDEKYSDEMDITISETMNLSDPTFGRGFDIIHFHSNANVETNALINFMRQVKKEGTKFVMDLDDYWMLPTYFPQYKTYNQQYKVHEKVIELIKHVDYITTTTELFAKEIRRYNDNVVVIPNAIDPREKQFEIINNNPSGKLRVGIICGSSHERDIDLLYGMVNQLKPELNRLQFVICGFDLNGTVTYYNPETKKTESRAIKPEETVWHKYEKILTDNYSIVSPEYKQFLMMHNELLQYPNVESESYRRYWTKPVSKYASHYNNIDVLLVPLVENKFNSLKSQLKVVETAFFNKVIIAQDFGPYQLDLVPYIKKGGEVNENGNALLVDSAKNHKQWAKYIKFLLDNPEARQKMANNLTEKITKEYSLETVSKIRFELYKKIAEL